MTTRLYYTDALRTSFDAVVVSSTFSNGRVEIVLDETAFYPTSGGQPHDTGTLGGRRVVDVVDREDGTVGHVVEGDATPASGTPLHGEIDWPRRLDHMQQHTGQHILSAAFERVCRARTMSFHLGAEMSTIDLARELTPEEIDEAERMANDVVWQDRELNVRFVTEDEASRLPLRKEPTRTGLLRLVEVPDVDLSACGGTHVPRMGVVGLIAVAGWERVKGGSRIAFVCGGRARRAHAHLRDVSTRAGRLLSSSVDDVPTAIERLQTELRAAGRAREDLAATVAAYRGASFRAEAETVGGFRVVLREEPGADGAALKALAGAVVASAGFVAVIVGDGQPAPVVVARSADVAFDAGAWLKAAIARFGGRGGGRPELAQGGLTADANRILAFARESIGALR